MSSKVLALRFLSGGCEVFGDFGTLGIVDGMGAEGVCMRAGGGGGSVRRKLAGRVITDQMARSRKIRRL
eukprot:3197219-Prymnesium_polylepis.1